MRRDPRAFIWVAVIVQVLTFAWEGLWHGVLNPEFERAPTVEAMRHHLSTVHIPFYVGIVALLAATTWALVAHIRRRGTGFAIPLVFAMAVGQVIGQVWDAVEHLRLSHGGPIAWTLIVLGFIGVPIVLWIDGWRRRRCAISDAASRRAA